MQEVVRDTRESYGHTYAEPLSGLRVSWGSLLAGGLVFVAVAVILWALALAIVALATHADPISVRASAIALWICAMGTTIIGSWVGGWFAGYLQGNPRRAMGAAHGFLAWAVAFVFTFVVGLTLVSGAAGAAASVIAGSAPAAVETAPGGQNMGPQGATPYGAPGAPSTPGGTAEPGVAPSSPQAAHTVGSAAVGTMIALGWSWFGTWAISAILATAAGAAAAGRSRGTALPETHVRDDERGRRFGPPLTPAPST